MTLSRKILLKNGAMLASLAMLAIVAFVGLVGLGDDVSVVLDEYNELRLIERAVLHVATAKGLLNDDHLNRGEITRELSLAIDSLERFSQMQGDFREGSERHEQVEESVGAGATTRLRYVRQQTSDAIDLARRDKEVELQTIQAVLDDLMRLSNEMDHLAEATRAQAARKMLNTILLLAGCSVAAIVGAVLVSIWQYRGIMHPLQRLRTSVHNISAGHFEQRLDEQGEAEFAELARDFNCMAEELNDLYRSLEQKVITKSRELARSERLASVGFLAAGVAHEINNPLNIISGFSELSLERLAHSKIASMPEVAEASESMRIIIEEAFRCKQITEKLLSLAKPGTGNRETLSLSCLVAQMGTMICGLKQYRDRKLVIEPDPTDDPMVILANATEMKQVLLNLTVNALESVPPGLGEVRITGVRNNGWVEIRVHDNGSGMSPEVVDHVFEPFFTAKGGNASDRGNGLGLSISYAIIEAHGGHIRAESPGANRGSTFTIQLPAAKAVTADAHNGDSQ